MANKWSSRRKKFIFSLVVLAVLILVGIPTYLFFYKAPTCFDGKQNGDEGGVDCGGSCQLLCAVESLPIVQKGDARIITIAPGVYEVAALFENPNASADIYRAGYTIRLYSAESAVPVRVIEGEVYVPKGGRFAVFEPPFALVDSVPVRAVFSWKPEALVWKKSSATLPDITILSTQLSGASTTPRLELSVQNKSLETIDNLELIVLISDDSGNIFAASKTFIDRLLPGATGPAAFAWPRAFAQEPGLIDVVPRILPDRSFIR